LAFQSTSFPILFIDRLMFSFVKKNHILFLAP
jgi:hypothetical protein